MKFAGYLTAMALLSACSATIIPQGAVRSNASVVPPVSATLAGGNQAANLASKAGPPALPIIPLSTDRLIVVGNDPGRAAGAGVALGPAVDSLRLQPLQAAAALASFRTSCPTLVRQVDVTGLTEGGDWKPSCDAAQSWPEKEAIAFFTTYFETTQIGNGSAFATGYFEPQIDGSRVRTRDYQIPIYRRPANLVDVELGLFKPELKDQKLRGKINGNMLVPFDDRAQIDDGSLKGQGLEIAWAKDYIDLFFLQVQGSGRLALPDGSIMRIGYEAQNGREYTGIGRVMGERGLLASGKSTMQGIVEWLRAHPREGMEIMRQNQSYVFFRELTGAGPLGAMGYPVVGRTSVAADRNFVPLGAPIFLNVDHDIADGLWVAQDTGGAIKGANRFDTFWGAGAEASQIAGGMSSRGQALIFLPKGAFAKLANLGQRQAR